MTLFYILNELHFKVSCFSQTSINTLVYHYVCCNMNWFTIRESGVKNKKDFKNVWRKIVTTKDFKISLVKEFHFEMKNESFKFIWSERLYYWGLGVSLDTHIDMVWLLHNISHVICIIIICHLGNMSYDI